MYHHETHCSVKWKAERCEGLWEILTTAFHSSPIIFDGVETVEKGAPP